MALTEAKKIKGRKRHIVVDTMGNLLAVVVHAANVHDTKSGITAAEIAFRDYPEIRRFCADAGYRGTFEREVEEKLHLSVDICERASGTKWEILVLQLHFCRLSPIMTHFGNELVFPTP